MFLNDDDVVDGDNTDDDSDDDDYFDTNECFHAIFQTVTTA